MAEITYDEIKNNSDLYRGIAKSIKGNSLGVTDASQIGYSYKTVTENNVTINILDKSIKDKIDEIDNSIDSKLQNLDADDIQYSENKSVKEKIDEINNSQSNAENIIYSPRVLYTYQEYIALPGNSEITLEEFDALPEINKIKTLEVSTKLKIESVEAQIDTLDAEDISFTPTGGSKTTVNSVLNNFESQVNSVELRADQINTIYSNISNASGKINNLEEIALDLQSSLDTSAQFIICSSNTYNNITPSNNTIYFCYDEDDPSNIATLTINVNNVLYGQVIGGGSYTKGTQINLIALPNDGYRFDEWSNGSSLNPYLITLDDDVILTANFVSYD